VARQQFPPAVEILLTAFNQPQGPGFLAKWDVKTWQITARMKVCKERICKMQVSSDGRLVALASTDSVVAIHRLSDLRRITMKKAVHDMPATSLAFSPDQSFVLSCSGDKTIDFTSTRPGPGPWKNILLVLLNLVIVFALAYYVWINRSHS